MRSLDAIRETVEWLQRNPVTKADYPMYPATFDYELEDRLIASWARAVDRVSAEAPDEPPELAHPRCPTPRAAVARRGRARSLTVPVTDRPERRTCHGSGDR